MALTISTLLSSQASDTNQTTRLTICSLGATRPTLSGDFASVKPRFALRFRRIELFDLRRPFGWRSSNLTPSSRSDQIGPIARSWIRGSSRADGLNRTDTKENCRGLERVLVGRTLASGESSLVGSPGPAA